MKKLWQIGSIPFVLFLLATSIAVASTVEPLAQDERAMSLSEIRDVAQVGPSAVNVDGPTAGTVDTAYDFPITVDPIDVTLPISYSLIHSDMASPWSGILPTRAFTTPGQSWETPGTKTITVTAKNLHGTAVGTHTIVINEAAGTKVTLTGPDSGMTNMPYTFTATISPITASVPITYTFEASDGWGPTSGTFDNTNPINWRDVSWSTPGAKLSQ